MRRKILVGLAIVVGALLLAVTAAVLYLQLGDLGRHRGALERLASNAIGRELRIAGSFEPDIGFTTRLVAGEVSLANPPDWPEPYMVSVDSLEIELDLLSLLFGPITIHDIEADGARVLLEADAEGRATWDFDTDGKDTDGDGGPLEIVVGNARLSNVGLVFRTPSLPRAIELTNADLELQSDDTGMVDLELGGGLNGAALELAGRLGTLGSVLVAGEVEHDLEGRLGDVDLALRGRIGDLASLGGADIVAELTGPNLEGVGELFRIPALPAGPFRIEAAASPAPGGSSVALDGILGEITVDIDGTVDSLISFADLDVKVAASGPSVAEVGALAGLDELPPDQFTVSGRVHWQGFPVSFEGFEATVGDNHLSIEGVLGAPPQMLDTDFRIRAAGPDIGALAALVGLDLPATDFQIDAHALRVEGGVRLDEVAARIGRTTLDVDGIVGDPPEFVGTELSVSARGPDLSAYGGLLGVDLPAESFELSGRLTPDGDDIVLDGVKARLGSNTGQVEGKIVATAGFVGTNLQVKAKGPGLRWLEPITSLSDLPAEPYRVDGGLRILANGYRLTDVKADLGALSLQVDGLVGSSPGLEGTVLTVKARGPDASHPASLAGLSGIPRASFRLDGAVKVTDDGYVLEGIDAALGDIVLKADGRVGNHPDLHGSALTFDAGGPRLSELGPLVDQTWLPAAPFAVSGVVAVGPDGYRLEQVTAELAGHRVEANGTVVAAADFAGTDLDISFGGSDLGHIGRMVADTDLVELPALPEEPYTLTGGLRIDETGYELRAVDLTLGNAEGRIDGKIGALPDLHGTDITIDGDGPNASLFTAVTGVTVPVAPFRFHGRIERLGSGFRFHEVRAQLGEYRATADGVLGELPKLIGTDFELHAEGPSLALFEQIFDLPRLPDERFEVDGHLDGNARRFKTDRLSVRLGESDVRGWFRLDLSGKPTLEAELESDQVDLARFLARRVESEQEEAVEEDPPPAQKRDRLISDEPFELSFVRDADADVVWNLGKLAMPVEEYSDVTLDLILEDGRLQLGPLAATGSLGGRLETDVVLEPMAEAYELRTRLTLRNGRFNLSKGESGDGDPGRWPLLDINIEFSGVGNSVHEMASTSNGNVIIVLGEGIMDRSMADLVTADILVTLMEKLNPFAKEETSTTLECAVIVTTFDDGIATFDPMAVQTDRMTMLGKGKVDLSTEKLNLEWVTKPRKGLGLSASMVTNPYISLGGTLAEPSLSMKPLDALTTTGVAVATGGLSILGRGLWDRVTAEKKVCKKAIEKARRQAEERSKR